MTVGEALGEMIDGLGPWITLTPVAIIAIYGLALWMVGAFD